MKRYEYINNMNCGEHRIRKQVEKIKQVRSNPWEITKKKLASLLFPIQIRDAAVLSVCNNSTW